MHKDYAAIQMYLVQSKRHNVVYNKIRKRFSEFVQYYLCPSDLWLFLLKNAVWIRDLTILKIRLFGTKEPDKPEIRLFDTREPDKPEILLFDTREPDKPEIRLFDTREPDKL